MSHFLLFVRASLSRRCLRMCGCDNVFFFFSLKVQLERGPFLPKEKAKEEEVAKKEKKEKRDARIPGELAAFFMRMHTPWACLPGFLAR